MMTKGCDTKALHIGLRLLILAVVTVGGLSAWNVFTVLHLSASQGIAIGEPLPHVVFARFAVLWTVVGLAWCLASAIAILHRRYFQCAVALVAAASSIVAWCINVNYFARCVAQA
jgi:hypothetical protein